MKKIKFWLPIISIALLLSSCIIKSIRPFYTLDLVYFEPKLLGNWTIGDLDSKDGSSFNVQFLPVTAEGEDFPIPSYSKDAKTILVESESFLSHKKSLGQRWSKEGYQSYIEKYKFNKGYIANLKLEYYAREGFFGRKTDKKIKQESSYLAMPFKINNQLFLDFTPISKSNNVDFIDFYFDSHLIVAHSLAKVDIFSKDSISLKWVGEDKIGYLIRENKLKIKHEMSGFNYGLLLTASSEELVKFFEKYIKNENEEEWRFRDPWELIKIKR